MDWYLSVLQNYAVFDGRARRKEYWMFFLVNFIIYLVFNLLSRMIWLLGILTLIYLLATLIPAIAVGIRRLHDTNRSGWWLLIGFIPIIGTIILLVFMIQDSQPGENRFGPNPKEVTDAAAPQA